MKLRDLPIGRKLTLGAVCVSATAVLGALLACFLLQLHLARRAAERDLSALAEVVAANAAGPLAFMDAAAAEALLHALRARPEIIGARLRDAAGARFSVYQARGDGDAYVAPQAGRSSRTDRLRIYVEAPVVHAGERLGTLELTADISGSLREFASVAAVAFLAFFGAALLVAAFLANRWQRAITGPLLGLAQTAREVAASKDYTLRAAEQRRDEIGQLAVAFNEMLVEIDRRDLALREAQAQLSQQVDALRREIAERERAEAELARTHQDLVEASRRAGQAEVATSVLHNVGNVLNSVGVSASVASGRLRRARIANVQLVAGVLRENRERLGPFFSDDAKGRALFDFLPQLAEHLETERAAVMGELAQIATNVEHIRQVVAMQQSYAKVGGVRERLRPVEVVEHALALNADSIAQHGITVIRRYEDVPAHLMDKHRVLQILVNLIANAKNALKASTRADRTIAVSLATRERTLLVSVSDNGVGIPAENLDRIFQHGFTTRKDGHGFGLHSGALAARQLGGRLAAESPGAEQGATFTLELPMDDPASVATELQEQT